MRFTLVKTIIFLSLCLFNFQNAHAYKPSGFLDLNAYGDIRAFSVLTLNSKLDLPGPFSYFSFVNWQGNPTGDEFGDISHLYITEQNLYAKLGSSPFDLQTQYFSITGEDNDVLRFGLQSRIENFPTIGKLLKKLHAWCHITYFPWQVDSIDTYASQLQYVWYMKILPKLFHDRVYIYGFADQNFNTDSNGPHTKLVAENQFGVRLWKGLHAITELRWNGFFPEGDRFGLGLGLQYKVVF